MRILSTTTNPHVRKIEFRDQGELSGRRRANAKRSPQSLDSIAQACKLRLRFSIPRATDDLKREAIFCSGSTDRLCMCTSSSALQTVKGNAVEACLQRRRQLVWQGIDVVLDPLAALAMMLAGGTDQGLAW